MSSFNHLQNIGLTNKSSPDFGEIGDSSNDIIATYCSSFYCVGNSNLKKGKIVKIGRIYECPFCHNKDHLIHDDVTPRQAQKFLGKNL